jgi:hypothetical protein
LGDVWAGNYNSVTFGSNLVANLIDKVPTGTSGSFGVEKPLDSYLTGPDNALYMSSWAAPIHAALTLANTTSPTVKALPYLTRENGKAYLQLLYKEMIYDVDWGDDSKLDVVDGESTTTDDNANTVKIGQKEIELPYFVSEET